MQETRETQVWSLGQEDPLEKEMATHPNILAWKIPWTESLTDFLFGSYVLELFTLFTTFI